MGVLFNRVVRVTVDTISIESGSLRVGFGVTKNLKEEPNKANVKIFNLSPSHRNQLEQKPDGVAVSIEAGYQPDPNAAPDLSRIFLGTLRTSITVREGPDLVTGLESADGEKQVQTSRVAKSFARGTTTDAVFRELAKGIGVGDGNLEAALKTIKAKFSGAGNVFPGGTVIYGSAAREMTRICASLDLEWSIQDGKLQILERGKTTLSKALVLSKDTGMLDSPTVDNKGVLTVKTLMIPDVFPGRIVVLNSQRLQGQYRIEETSHAGDSSQTEAGEFSITIKAKRY